MSSYDYPLKVGEWYQMRNGEITQIVQETARGLYRTLSNRAYFVDGRLYRHIADDCDLMLHIEPPSIRPKQKFERFIPYDEYFARQEGKEL